jgi:DNA-binding NarL/FixJ family response regulator
LEQPIRIAIVEDHELTRIGLQAVLQRREGIEVVGGAANGYQGLALLKNLKPDLAIVDIGLPDIDGIELIRLFRESQCENSRDQDFDVDHAQERRLGNGSICSGGRCLLHERY